MVTAERLVAADADAIFELIADPAQQPRWDGNDNLQEAAAGQRVRAVGDTFTTMLTIGSERLNRIVEFEEGRRIAWRPSELDSPRPGICGAGSSSPAATPARARSCATPTTGPS